MREVIHYERREQNLTACRLCPKLCSIREGKYGFCGVRQNRGGTLFATNYGKVSSCALDPIEKKPLSAIFRVAPVPAPTCLTRIPVFFSKESSSRETIPASMGPMVDASRI
jgi:hypothetical protein